MAQAIQNGVVKEYKETSKKVPLANVEVLVSDAGQRVSATDGSFQLRFRTQKPGDHVSVTRIEKLGYEVFNKEAIEQWNISESNHPFVIVMCNSSKFKKIRDNYEQITSQSYAQQQLKEKKLLEAERSSGKLKESEFHEKLLQLQDEYDKQLELARPYIDKFARIDLSEVTGKELKIIKLIQSGKIDEGIELYKNLHPEEIFKNNRSLRKELDDDAYKAFQMACRKNEALMMQGGRDNLRLVEESLRSMAESDTTYLYALSAYSIFLFDRDRHQENLRYLHLINECGKRNFHHYLASMYYSTGYAYQKLRNYKEAEKYYIKSRESNEKYNKQDSLTYMENVSIYLGGMADIYRHEGRYEEEGKYRERECAILDSLMRFDPKRFGNLLQLSLGNLTQYYLDYQPEKVDSVMLRMKKLQEHNLSTNQNDQQSMEAMLLFQKAMQARFNNDFIHSDSLFKHAIDYLAPLYRKDKQRYNGMYGPLLGIRGFLYYENGMRQDAAPLLLQALPICEEILQQNPQGILETLATIQLLLGQIKMDDGYIKEADSLFMAAYQNCLIIEDSKEMTMRADSIVINTKLMCASRLALSCLALGKEDEAVKYLLMQIHYDADMKEKYGDSIYVSGTWYALYNLGMVRWKQKEYEKAENCFFDCTFFVEDGVTKPEDMTNVNHLLVELFHINKHYDKGLLFVNTLLEDAEGKERLGLLHAKGVYYLDKGDMKNARRIWNILKKNDISGIDEESPLLKAFRK